MRTKLWPVLAIVAVSLAATVTGCAPGTSGGDGGGGDTPGGPTRAQINALWSTLEPVDTSPIYDTTPSWVAPYVAGELHREYAQQGVNVANFARFLAGVPHDLTLDDGLLDQAQHGAVLLAAVGQLTHTPPKPADMDQAFYDRGRACTGSSNLYWSSGAGPTPEQAVRAFLSDSDSSNVAWLGHRRWVLNPPMQRTAFGVANGYISMQVFDTSRAATPDWTRIGWPAPGNMPVEFFAAGEAWSVTLNPAVYDRTHTAGIALLLERPSSGESWSFTAADTSPGGRYLKVDGQMGYGVPFCVIFRAPGLVYTAGDRFRVTLSGLTPLTPGAASTLSYETTFFALGS
jgi:hypothetical protein